MARYFNFKAIKPMDRETPESKCTLTCKQALVTVQKVLDTEYQGETQHLWAKRKFLNQVLETNAVPDAFEKAWRAIAKEAENDELAVTRFLLAIQSILDKGHWIAHT